MKKYLYIFFVLLLTLPALAQMAENKTTAKIEKSKQQDKKHKLSTRLVKKKSYFNAIDHLVDLTKTDSTNRDYLYHLAETYLMIRDYKRAEESFAKVVKLDGENITQSLYYYAVSLKHNGKYEDAEGAFADFANSKFKEAKGDKLKAFAKNEVESCRWAQVSMISAGSVTMKNAGDTINANYSDFSPKWKSKDTLVYSSLQADSVITVENGEAHFYHVKMFQSSHNSGVWSTPVEVKGVNTTYENNANGYVTPDGKQFYFTRCEPNRHNEMVCDIYVAPIENGQIGKARRLPDPVNMAGYTSTQPFVVSQQQGKNKVEVIYFSSNRPGGKGGMDIWQVTKGKGGVWGKAQSMGREINTIGDDITPFYDVENEVFYFSSNYHYGFGGYDVIKIDHKGNRWGKAENLGWDYNSSADDTYFLKYNKTDGFLVSNRIGGFNLKSETCCDDIYLHSTVEPVRLQVRIVGLLQKQLMDSIEVRKPYVKGAKSQKGTMKAAVARLETGSMDVVTLDGDTISSTIFKRVPNNMKAALLQGFLSKEVGDTVQSFNFALEPNQEYIVRTRRKGVLLEEVFETYDTISFSGKLEDTLKLVKYNVSKKEDQVTVLRIEPLRRLIEHVDTVIVQIGDTSIIKTGLLAQEKLIEEKQNDPALAKGNLTGKQAEAKQAGTLSATAVDAQATGTAASVAGGAAKSGTKSAVAKETVAKGTASATVTETIVTQDPKKVAGMKSKTITETKIDSVNQQRQQAFLDSMKREREGQKLIALKRKQAKDSVVLALTQSKFVVYFDYKEKSFLDDPQIQELVSYLSQHSELAVEVGAYTDNIGGDKYNKQLSEARARSIVSYLFSQGINKKRIIAKGYGQSNPVAPNTNEDGTDNPEGRSKNRRAELKLVKLI